jgi:glutathione S-transferase/RNA polymerase-associated protein
MGKQQHALETTQERPMTTVIDIPLSPYAQKVKMALLEKNIPFDVQHPDLDASDVRARMRNPRAEVPVLQDAGADIFQSSIILEYIEERWPTPALLPKEPSERARVRMLQEICDTSYDAVNWGVSEILFFKRAEGPLAETMLERARTQIRQLNARIERELQTRPWLNGDHFGFGDIVVYPFVNGAAALGNKPEPGSKLQTWLDTMRARPSAARLKQDIQASLAQFASRPQDVATGKHRRQYRDHRVDWMLRSGGLEIVTQGIQANNIRFSYDID